MQDKHLSQEQMKDIWKKYINGEKCDTRGVRGVILDSWERSRNNSIDPFPQKAPVVFQDAELKKHKEKYADLISISVPIMRNLYKFVAGAGFITALTDCNGCLMEIFGSDEVEAKAQEGNFLIGGLWNEKTVGTNSIGTALYLDQPVQIRGREHYCLMFHRWSCSAAPIHDPEGKIIGALDISGPYEKVHPHTLGMVVTAVSAIETQLKLKKASNALESALRSLESANNYKSVVIESISEGLLAVDSNGIVTHINRIIAQYIGMNTQEALGKRFYELIDERNKALYDIVVNTRFVTDYEIDIYAKSGKNTCLVTSCPINSTGVREGMVLLFSEISRARRLVQRMSGSEGNLTFTNLLGREARFTETVELARKAAGSTSNVLLLGESGTGKDLFAQAIHNASIRKQGPFVAINCGAIPRELIASELFGYTDGAFTGAKRGGKLGKFELAHGGTIFLDEIGEMPLELQTTLLRVLETRTITRLGGNDISPVDVRIIAATNKDLTSEINKGRFRSDLFYRLNVFTIRMIPLRERKEDIPLLVEHFLETLCLKLKKQPIRQVDKKVWELFNNYYWPGNIRELQNVLERVVNVCHDRSLTVKYLPEEISFAAKSSSSNLPVRSYEKELIMNLLEQHNHNIRRVAKELGIARTTLYRKIAKYNLQTE